MEVIMSVLDAQSTDYGSSYKATHVQVAQDSAVLRFAWSAVLHDCPPPWKQWATWFFKHYLFIYFPIILYTCRLSAQP